MMPKRDALHDAIRRALEKAGWTITHDPLVLPMDGRNLFVDLAAEDGERQIAVEIKGFGGKSFIANLEQALGQYILYRTRSRLRGSAREIFLAVPQDKFGKLLNGPQTREVLRLNDVKLLVFNSEQEEIVEWIEWN